MSFNISDAIINYTGDYDMPSLSQKDAREALCKKYGCCERLLYTQVLGRKSKIGVLIKRFILEEEVGECFIINKQTSKPLTAKITCTIDELQKMTYKVWFDEATSVRSIGEMTIEFFRRASSGEVVAHSQQEGSGFCDYYIKNYIGKAPGTVHIHQLNSSGRKEFGGVGSSCVQLAVEMSMAAGYGGRLCLDASGDSHPFYKKVHLTAGLLDADIDKELSRADKENRAPNTRHLGVRPMTLNDEGRDLYKQVIARRPILQKVEAAKVIKEENKSS